MCDVRWRKKNTFYDDTLKKQFLQCVLSMMCCQVMKNSRKLQKFLEDFPQHHNPQVMRHVRCHLGIFYGDTACTLVILVICVVLSITLYSVVFQIG